MSDVIVIDRIKKLRSTLDKQLGRKEQVEQDQKASEEKIENLTLDLHKHEQAQIIIQQVAQETQNQLKYHIAELVSLALSSIFDRPYEFDINFELKRGKTEAQLVFKRNGKVLTDPLHEAGGGVCDVAAFALRISLWSLQNPRTRNTLILDEPFSRLKGRRANERALKFVQEISNNLGIQIIMVSDERVPRDVIMDTSDKVFEFELDDEGVTLINEIK